LASSFRPMARSVNLEIRPSSCSSWNSRPFSTSSWNSRLPLAHEIEGAEAGQPDLVADSLNPTVGVFFLLVAMCLPFLPARRLAVVFARCPGTAGAVPGLGAGLEIGQGGLEFGEPLAQQLQVRLGPPV